MQSEKSGSKSLLETAETSTSGAYETRTTFADGYSRRSTFSRAFTFDGDAIQKSIAQPFTGLTRTLTEVGNRFDPDAQFTKAVIKEYIKHSESGIQGDVPLPPGFARKSEFWKLVLLSGIVACIVGVATAGFMNFTDKIPKQWDTCSYGTDFSCGDWYSGKLHWIAITGSTGFAVGLIRWAAEYPENMPGIFLEITHCHVDPKWSPLIYILSAMSLGGGATLGPEQALGNVGGGLATWVSEHIEFEDEEYKKLFVLSGMSSALGALFPTPMLGALMIHELGNPPKTFMESTMILSVASVIGFVVYYALVEVSYLEPVSSSGIKLSEDWLKDPGYQNWQVGTGVAVGIISAALCLMVVLTIGITKQIFARMRMRLAHNKFLKEILPPTIGGLCIGTVNWALPATVGNGNMIFTWILKFGAGRVVSEKLLLCTAFARMFNLGISMNCGFIGGIIFPFLTMGMLAGTVMYLHFDYLPLGLCVGTFMISLPCGIVPMPFTFTCLSVFIYFFGLYQVVPVFVSAFTSYLIVCGSGLFKKLSSSQANAKTGATINSDMENENKLSEIAKSEADDFALKQYLGSKKNVTVEAKNALR